MYDEDVVYRKTNFRCRDYVIYRLVGAYDS
jgi:hypothetical protein